MGWWLLPTPLVIRLLLGTHYVFAFPFCPNWAPEHFKLKPVRPDSSSSCSPMHPKRLLDSLLPMPPDIQAERDLSWLQRKFS